MHLEAITTASPYQANPFSSIPVLLCQLTHQLQNYKPSISGPSKFKYQLPSTNHPAGMCQSKSSDRASTDSESDTEINIGTINETFGGVHIPTLYGTFIVIAAIIVLLLICLVSRKFTSIFPFQATSWEDPTSHTNPAPHQRTEETGRKNEAHRPGEPSHPDGDRVVHFVTPVQDTKAIGPTSTGTREVTTIYGGNFRHHAPPGIIVHHLQPPSQLGNIGAASMPAATMASHQPINWPAIRSTTGDGDNPSSRWFTSDQHAPDLGQQAITEMIRMADVIQKAQTQGMRRLETGLQERLETGLQELRDSLQRSPPRSPRQSPPRSPQQLQRENSGMNTGHQEKERTLRTNQRTHRQSGDLRRRSSLGSAWSKALGTKGPGPTSTPPQ